MSIIGKDFVDRREKKRTRIYHVTGIAESKSKRSHAVAIVIGNSYHPPDTHRTPFKARLIPFLWKYKPLQLKRKQTNE